jgi:hypothetical protein
MGPNNGEHPSGGAATLEPPQASSVVSPDGGNGLIPTPGASAPETSGSITQAEDVAAKTWTGTAQQPAATAVEKTTPGVNPSMSEAKPLNSADPLKTPDMQSLNATQQNFFQEKAAAKTAPSKPGLGNRILGFIGLRGGVKTEVVGQSANAIPDHLKDGVTPPVPNVTSEAAAAVNREPSMASVPEATAPAADPVIPTATVEASSSTLGEVTTPPTPETPAPTSEVVTPPSDAVVETPETTDPMTTSAVSEADSIVKNATGTNAALDEIDKTANTALSDTVAPEAKPADASAFPSYDAPVEADKAVSTSTGSTPDAPTSTPSPDATSAWPAAPASEPTSSGPSVAAEPTVTTAPEYKPTSDLSPAGKAAAPAAPTNWSVDASASHPDAPVVGNTSAAAPEAVTAVPQDPNALKLETTPTPLPGTPPPTETPFGTGMPPSLGGAATESLTGITATPAEQPDTMTPTNPLMETEAPETTALSSDTSISGTEAMQGAGTPPPPAMESPSGNVDASGLSTGVAEVPGSGAMGQPLRETPSSAEPTIASASVPSAMEAPAAATSTTTETPAITDPLTASPTTSTS